MISTLKEFVLDPEIFGEASSIILVSGFPGIVFYKIERKRKSRERAVIITLFKRASFVEKLKSFPKTGMVAEIPIPSPKHHYIKVIIKKDFELDYLVGIDDAKDVVVNIFPITN